MSKPIKISYDHPCIWYDAKEDRLEQWPLFMSYHMMWEYKDDPSFTMLGPL